MTLGPVILDLESTTLTDAEKVLLKHDAVGGVIVFSRNIESYDQLQSLVAEIRAQRSELLICVDQEGGRVQRCKDGFTAIPPMQIFDRLYSDNSTEALALAKDCGWLLASEVLAIGMDYSYTPVLDVDDEFCSVIGDRAFSASSERVTKLAGAFIEGAREAGMAVTGKHFPGHGSVRGDSHLELPVDDRSVEDITVKDLKPFDQLKASLDAVMPAHILFPKIDAEAAVGFSKVWLQTILRQQMGYQGVIFSDDLTMEGATQMGTYPERAQAAIEAGCDMVLVCNSREGVISVLNELKAEHYHCNRASRESMRARASVDRGELTASGRWQKTHQRLEQLVKQANA
ncbi:MAG: beta-N-acetylhexosaminidase [Cellvibrionaceae bacterium]